MSDTAQQEELFTPRVLFADRDREKDMAIIIDKLIEQFTKTGKFDREKPFGHAHYVLDIAQMLFEIPEGPFYAWAGYTREQFQYCEELWNDLGDFIVEWWKQHRP